MSDLLEAVAFVDELNNKKRSANVRVNNNHKRILRSKENLFKPKCNKEMKNKLRKYKLRRDGTEDQDVLDVSQILVNSLRIKSPNNSDNIYNKNNKAEESKPNNYLFKMVRHRKICPQKETNCDNVNISQNVNNILFDEESQTCKQMDAFKLLMDSRNKSIGSNSPGKEKSADESISLEIVEKKANKAKRVLSLQKMAENKGSLKKKEIEDYREICIKKKMLKRAESFKDMLTKTDTKNLKKEQSTESNVLNTKQKKEHIKNIVTPNNLTQNNKTLKLCDIFSDTNTIIDESKPLQSVSDEDIEFLNKLSPSLRKKENMLCYFKKLSKESEMTSEQSEINCSDENSKSIIKVKFTPKRKKKIKTKTSKSVDDDLSSETISKTVKAENIPICDSNTLDIGEKTESNDNRKRKRNKKVNLNIKMETINNNDCRPKRHTKKPVKYTENVDCFSSDEELHIFTPKKKRNSDSCLKTKVKKYIQDTDVKVKNVEMTVNEKNNKVVKTSESNNDLSNQMNKDKSHIKRELKSTKNINDKNLISVKIKNNKKTSKLAPIFVPKPQISQAALEAKQKFLKSGVPEKLKKCIVQQTNSSTDLTYFYSVSHIQQNDCRFSNYQGKDWFKFTSNNIEEINIKHNFSFKSLLTTVSTEILNVSFQKHKPEKVLKYIKNAYPKFPVYRTYHKLRNKCKGDYKDFNYMDLDNSIEIIDNCVEINNDNPEKLNWCEKYKPTTSKQIIGNFESVKELKRWLETWSEKLIKDKSNGCNVSDTSDFYCSDVDSRDAIRSTNNFLIVTGQTGSGKTSSVYAVAAELAIKVIEVNASSKRNGKIMLQDLQEATQSHKVNRAKSGIDISQKLSQEVSTIPKVKKRGRPKKSVEDVNAKINTATPNSEVPSSQECIRTAMSLILIDDADIIFDQDDGFCSAISQLINSSKRPVILVTSSPSCPHLQKFLQNAKVIHMRPLLPRMLGTWLDIMCLADVGQCFIGLGEKVLDFFKGDIRKSINCLQFYMNSFKSSSLADEATNSQVLSNIDDENSSMSWADTVSLECQSSNEFESLCNIDKESKLVSYNAPNVFDVWWNLPSHFSIIKNEGNMKGHSEYLDKRSEIRVVENILDTLSTIDYLDCISSDTRSNTTLTPWHYSETASLLESEDFNSYNESLSIGEEISNVLMMSTISKAQREFKTEKSISYLGPSMSYQRERERIVSRHTTLSSYLNPSAVLDRRAMALDYWSSCRTICRLEKSKTDNIKRKNRFCHYLKSLNVLCKNDFFDNLADSLT